MSNIQIKAQSGLILPKRIPNLIGKKFHLLTVVSFSGKDKRNNSLWECLCDCGNTKIIRGFFLKNGETKSCGCLVINQLKDISTTHGVSGHKLYKILEGIKARCYNKNVQSYKRYGAVGVTVCQEWLDDPRKFIQWALDSGWEKGLQIDKDIIPQKLGITERIYSPEMCSVVTAEKNTNNRKSNHYLTHNGITATLSEWGKVSGVSGKQIKRNLDKGWDMQESIYNYRNKETNN